MAYKSILLKVSGEALGGEAGLGLDVGAIVSLAIELKPVHDAGVSVAVVIGAGNLIRGRTLMKACEAQGLQQVSADQMGMLCTIVNSLVVRDVLARHGIPSVILAAHGMPTIVDSYSIEAARQALTAGKVVICAGGTGNPLFTTDTAACLRGIELDVDVVIKSTQVDGVYDGDPHKDPYAQRYHSLTFQQAIEQRLAIVDMTASALCQEHGMPLIVHAFKKKGALFRIVNGSDEGTIIRAVSDDPPHS